MGFPGNNSVLNVANWALTQQAGPAPDPANPTPPANPSGQPPPADPADTGPELDLESLGEHPEDPTEEEESGGSYVVKEPVPEPVGERRPLSFRMRSFVNAPFTGDPVINDAIKDSLSGNGAEFSIGSKVVDYTNNNYDWVSPKIGLGFRARDNNETGEKAFHIGIGFYLSNPENPASYAGLEPVISTGNSDGSNATVRLRTRFNYGHDNILQAATKGYASWSLSFFFNNAATDIVPNKQGHQARGHDLIAGEVSFSLNPQYRSRRKDLSKRAPSLGVILHSWAQNAVIDHRSIQLSQGIGTYVDVAVSGNFENEHPDDRVDATLAGAGVYLDIFKMSWMGRLGLRDGELIWRSVHGRSNNLGPRGRRAMQGLAIVGVLANRVGMMAYGLTRYVQSKSEIADSFQEQLEMGSPDLRAFGGAPLFAAQATSLGLAAARYGRNAFVEWQPWWNNKERVKWRIEDIGGVLLAGAGALFIARAGSIGKDASCPDVKGRAFKCTAHRVMMDPALIHAPYSERAPQMERVQRSLAWTAVGTVLFSAGVELLIDSQRRLRGSLFDWMRDRNDRRAARQRSWEK